MKNNEILYVLGTKAQFIKSKFILENLIKYDFKIFILDTGQHKEITSSELNYFKNNFEYISISNNKKNISSIFSMIIWFTKVIFSNNKINTLKNGKYCLVHGDTISTLIGLIVGKKNNLEVVHIESGLRSFSWFKPFPEEIIRTIVTRFSDILSVDSKEAERNVGKYQTKKKIIRLSRNTIYDSVVMTLNDEKRIESNNLIVTIHRTENIYNKKRLKSLVSLLIKLKKENLYSEIEWYCHDITINALERNNLIMLLKSNDVHLKKLILHDDFINKIYSSKAVITDGGSIAEECSIMNLRTVLWRDVVENKEYLNDNMLLSKYNHDEIVYFLNKVSNSNKISVDKISPSQQFVEQLMSL
jgi:UDP-N-acetylglucosamine 2-epimerase (non-hydrolysing)